jgi:CheY-like chemotaxis protein
VAEQNRTVLVEEDSRDDAELIGLALRKAGVKEPLQTVPNPEEAIRYLQGEGHYSDRQRFPMPQFVLLDHEMPGDGGLVLRWVRARAEFSALPVVFFTGSMNPGHESRAMAAGANAYYRKPQHFTEFVETLKGIWETWLGGGGLLKAE